MVSHTARSRRRALSGSVPSNSNSCSAVRSPVRARSSPEPRFMLGFRYKKPRSFGRLVRRRRAHRLHARPWFRCCVLSRRQHAEKLLHAPDSNSADRDRRSRAAPGAHELAPEGGHQCKAQSPVVPGTVSYVCTGKSGKSGTKYTPKKKLICLTTCRLTPDTGHHVFI